MSTAEILEKPIFSYDAANNSSPSSLPNAVYLVDRMPRTAKIGRKDRVHVGAYLPLAYKRNIRLLQAETGEDLQAILARVLNEQFRLRGIPEVQA